MKRRHWRLERGKEWVLLQQWTNVETHVIRGYGTVAEAPGKSMSPTEAGRLMLQLRKEGWK